jgi:hypothetical protein
MRPGQTVGVVVGGNAIPCPTVRSRISDLVQRLQGHAGTMEKAVSNLGGSEPNCDDEGQNAQAASCVLGEVDILLVRATRLCDVIENYDKRLIQAIDRL